MPTPEYARQQVLDALALVVVPEDLERIKSQPDQDLFTLGLNSLRSFTALDELADQGVDVDFGEFMRQPTLDYLVETYQQQVG